MSPEAGAAQRNREGDRRDAGVEAIGAAGFIDVVSGRRISGWAWDPSQPEQRLDVSIRVDDVEIAKVRADRPRKDLVDARVGDGCYGFEAQSKIAIGENDRHRVTAFVTDRDGVSVPLVNHAAKLAKISVLKPDDVIALRTAIEAWPEERRELHDQLLRYLQAVAIELRGLRNAVRGEGADTAADPVSESVEALRRTQGELDRKISQIDIFHSRFDTALSEISSERKTRDAVPADKGLQRMVLALAVVSGLSLLLGLYSVLR
jgi:hypothetical protein